MFGGPAPALNAWRIGLTGDPTMPASYMMAACVVGMVAMGFLVETAGCSLRGVGLPGRVRDTRPHQKPGSRGPSSRSQVTDGVDKPDQRLDKPRNFQPSFVGCGVEMR